MEIVFALENIESAASEFLQVCGDYKVFAFSGDLGAGKTTFINSLCKVLAVEESITSPTYSIIQEYVSVNNNIVYHIDLYRIKAERKQ
jgi:tRNA threonylcarbamoyladenosine biosynthesis protein TsaE